MAGLVAMRRPSGARFSLDGPGATGTTRHVSGPSSILGLDALLALQAVGDATSERRRKAVRRGHDLLDALDGLKVALLSGRVAPSELVRLRGQLRAMKEASGDERLDEIIAHIELRAEVELAKLARAAGRH